MAWFDQYGFAKGAPELCYRLYLLCERKKRSPAAMAYNTLVQRWPEIVRLVGEWGRERQGTFDLGEE